MIRINSTETLAYAYTISSIGRHEVNSLANLKLLRKLYTYLLTVYTVIEQHGTCNTQHGRVISAINNYEILIEARAAQLLLAINEYQQQ